MRNIILIFIFLGAIFCQPSFVLAQKTFTLSGEITDTKSGNKLIGASVIDIKNNKGTSTDENGNYSLTLTQGQHNITYSIIGYGSISKEIELDKNLVLNIQLNPIPKKLDEIIISAEAPDHNVKSTEISVERLDIKEIEKIPVIMGETDIFKTIQLLPGITSIAEGRSGFIVRGSGIDQNLILMDGMPLYYSSHMQGLYSVFNSDAVDKLTIYKGGIPARYGGRGASVLDVRMKESNSEKFKTKLSIGLITSKISIEAPIIKNKLSIFLAGRSTKMSVGYLIDRTYNTDNEDKSIKGSGKSNDNNYRFFDPYESWLDINGKIIYKINDKNTLLFSTYVGKDSALVAGGLTEWGNRAYSIRFNHNFNKKLLSNTSIVQSKYYTQQHGGLYSFESGITTSQLKQEFSYFPNDKNKLRFGFVSEYQGFNHGNLVDTETNYGKFMPPMQGLESAVYIENDHKINYWLSANYGLRYSLYHRMGPGDSFTFDEESNEPLSSTHFDNYTDIMAFHNNLEPRLALTFLIRNNSSVKVSFSRNAQYLRLMTLGSEIQWYDIWMPSTENIDPMLTDQLAIGFFRNFFNDNIKLSAETYYKNLIGAADFEDGLHNYLIDNLEAYVATGKGRSYGLEVSVEKPKGRFTGRLSYNLGKSEYKIDVINEGRWYPNMFDKTHSLSLIANYKIMKGLEISSIFLFSTGRPVTLPESYYYVNGVPFPYWEGRNKYRLPDYHRLDFGIKYQPEFLKVKFKKINREIIPSFELSFYNVYNRRNIHTIEYTSGSSGKGENSHIFNPIGISTYGFMPSFLFNIQF